MITKHCETCKKTFVVFPYRAKTALFCSRACHDIGSIGRKLTDKHIENLRQGVKNNLPCTAYKKGQHASPKTEFKKNQYSHNKGKKYPEFSNDFNPQWKGNSVSYNGLHKWVSRHKGFPKKCLHCGMIDNLQWANTDHKYRRNLNDYIPLCCACHKKFDISNNNVLVPEHNKLNGRFMKN
jgi:hypothetical protein